MKIFITTILFFSLSFGFCERAFSQSLVEDANLTTSNTENADSFTETIKIISESKKIFILTNNNQQLGQGDFLSLALDNKLAARALVAKTHQGQVGIKILKIYSMAQWSKLRRNLDVQIIKGDDSYFNKKTQTAAETVENNKIKSEEDLYSGEVVAEEDFGTFDDKKNRHIKPDNIISIGGGYYTVGNTQLEGGGKRGVTEFNASWAYQFQDNYFVEGFYGSTRINDYPSGGIQTNLSHLILRLKYNIKGPLYTFFLPYIGYHQFNVSSPDAGNSNNQIQNDQENDAVNKLKKSGPIAGVTILRRLVPGWFIKADLGIDTLSGGFAIEF
ncbi:MAG: hypothetical protein AB7I27_16750 [Bacteriovoracaceae bacterium]